MVEEGRESVFKLEDYQEIKMYVVRKSMELSAPTDELGRLLKYSMSVLLMNPLIPFLIS